MKFLKISMVFLFVALVFSCSDVYDVYSDYERYVDLTEYKSYELLEHKNGFPIGASPINRQRLERAINREMKYLGYQESTEPDLLVSYFVKEKTVRQVFTYRNYYRRWHHPVWIAVNEYQQGTLVIDLIDRESEQVVWHGATAGIIYDDHMPMVEEQINAAVQAIFEKYQKDIKYYRPVAVR